ncbi:MAG: HisA/HisF-related TIM barrel protein [Candidatus Promineifilaceae bacterium]
MLVIPVLDLKDGKAVHAVRGERVDYKPVRGILGDGEDAFALAAAYRDQLGAETLYIADLDAIAGLRRFANSHTALLRSLCDAGLMLWVDAGVSTVEQAQNLIDLGVERVVIGSETLSSPAQLAALAARFPNERIVLSVDLLNGILRAPPEFSTPADLLELAVVLHIDSAILLDLAHVGAGTGPPIELLTTMHQLFPALSLYAGGGVRDRSDLAALKHAGAAGALVATAFHRGLLSAADLVQ